MPELKETIGQRLKRIRAERRLSLEKAAEATRVRSIYLQALEEDNYSVMSSAAQGRGFLKIYADYLGLDLDAAMRELQRADLADASPEPPAPEAALSTPEPDSAPSAPPASSEPTADRRPFWARLLRRSVPEADASSQPAPDLEAAPAMTEEPSPAPVAIPEVESEPEAVPEPAKKPTARKTRSSAKVSKPKGKTVSAKAKKPADKKKGSLKKPSAKKQASKRR